MAVLGLGCCSGFSLVGGHSLGVVWGCLIVVASRFLAPALEQRLNSCRARAYLLRGMWDLPRSGIKPVSPALMGGFFTTEPPGNLSSCFSNNIKLAVIDIWV